MKSAIHPAKKAFLAAAGLVSILSLPVAAQPQANDMPPKLEKVDELSPPAAAPASAAQAGPSTPAGRQIIEKRERGQVTSIEVRSGERSYYIDPGDEPGNVAPGDAQSRNTRTPQWKIFEFDLKRPSETGNAEKQPAPVAAPPAPVR